MGQHFFITEFASSGSSFYHPGFIAETGDRDFLFVGVLGDPSGLDVACEVVVGGINNLLYFRGIKVMNSHNIKQVVSIDSFGGVSGFVGNGAGGGEEGLGAVLDPIKDWGTKGSGEKVTGYLVTRE